MEATEVDEIEPVASSSKREHHDTLVALDSDSGDETIFVAKDKVIKYWLSPRGGLGCFATSFQKTLKEIGTLTGTEITIESQVKGIRVFGRNSGDVNDALNKLRQIEKPFVSFFLLLIRRLNVC